MRASLRRNRVTTTSPSTATTAKPSSQPPCPPRLALSSRSGPGSPPKKPPATAHPGRRHRAGPPAWPTDPPEPVVAEDQRPDAVVRRARDPRAIRRRRQRHEQRPSAADDDHRGTAGQQLAHGDQAPARRDPQPRRGDAPGRPSARRPSSSRSPCPRRRRTRRASASARPAARARGTTTRRRSTARAARRGCCGARPRPSIGVSTSTSPAEKPATRPNMRRVDVVGQAGARDAHERLRHEHALRAVAERPHRQRLHPQRQRRLVDGHHPALVEGPVEERVPARAHRSPAAL